MRRHDPGLQLQSGLRRGVAGGQLLQMVRESGVKRHARVALVHLHNAAAVIMTVCTVKGADFTRSSSPSGLQQVNRCGQVDATRRWIGLRCQTRRNCSPFLIPAGRPESRSVKILLRKCAGTVSPAFDCVPRYSAGRTAKDPLECRLRTHPSAAPSAASFKQATRFNAAGA